MKYKGEYYEWLWCDKCQEEGKQDCEVEKKDVKDFLYVDDDCLHVVCKNHK